MINHANFNLPSKNLTKKWQEEAYRAFMSDLKSKEMKEKWQNAEYRAFWGGKMREISNALWKNPEHRQRISELQRKRTSDPIWKARQSEITKNLWRDSEYRKKYGKDHFSKMANKLWENEETRKLHVAKAKKQWEDEAFRKKITELTRERGKEMANKNPQHFRDMAEKAGASLRENWKNPEYKKRVLRSKILGYANKILKNTKQDMSQNL